MQLQLIRAGALIELRDFDAARSDLDAALASATQRGDVAAEGDARRLLGTMHHAASRLDEARLELGQAVDLLRTVERPDRLARALRARGFIELFGGSLVDAEWFFGEADTLYRLLDDQRGLAWLEQHRAWISFLSGDMALARDRLNHAADALDKLGDRNGVGWAFGLLAFVEFFERHFAEAEALAELVIREADQRGDEWAVGMMQTLLADLRLWQGDLGEAANLADQARSRFKKLNDKFGLMQATAPLLRAQIALGQAGAAQRSTEELLTLAEMSVQGPFPLMAVAGAAMHRGDGATAVAIADRALAETDEMNGSAFEPHVARLVGLDAARSCRRSDGRVRQARTDGARAPVHQCGRRAAVRDDRARPAEALEHADQGRSRRGRDIPRRGVRLRRRRQRPCPTDDKSQATLSIEAAVVRALDVGDVVAIALATNAYQHLIGRPHPAFDQPTQLEAGWLTVIDNLPRAVLDQRLTRCVSSASISRRGVASAPRQLGEELRRRGMRVHRAPFGSGRRQRLVARGAPGSQGTSTATGNVRRGAGPRPCRHTAGSAVRFDRRRRDRSGSRSDRRPRGDAGAPAEPCARR